MPKKIAASDLDFMSGRRLRAVREVWDPKGIVNQEWFAGKIGTTRPGLANWEAGKLPDVRSMVRLYEWLGIPLEWIYLGQLRHVARDLAERLEAWCAEHRVVINGQVEEFPHETERRAARGDYRAAAKIPIRRPRSGSLHEPESGSPTG